MIHFRNWLLFFILTKVIVCQKKKKLGEICGGVSIDEQECEDGLICKMMGYHSHCENGTYLEERIEPYNKCGGWFHLGETLILITTKYFKIIAKSTIIDY